MPWITESGTAGLDTALCCKTARREWLQTLSNPMLVMQFTATASHLTWGIQRGVRFAVCDFMNLDPSMERHVAAYLNSHGSQLRKLMLRRVSSNDTWNSISQTISLEELYLHESTLSIVELEAILTLPRLHSLLAPESNHCVASACHPPASHGTGAQTPQLSRHDAGR